MSISRINALRRATDYTLDIAGFQTGDKIGPRYGRARRLLLRTRLLSPQRLVSLHDATIS